MSGRVARRRLRRPTVWLKKPADKARLNVLKGEVIDQAYQRLKVSAHRCKHAQREFRALSQQFQKRRLRDEEDARLFEGASIRRIAGVLEKSRFRKAFADAKDVDDLRFAGRIDAMDVDRALVHNVEALSVRTLPEQVVAFPKPFVHDKGRDPLQVFSRELGKQVAAAKRRCVCRTLDLREIVWHSTEA